MNKTLAITQLPVECIHHITGYLKPREVGKLLKTSKFFCSVPMLKHLIQNPHLTHQDKLIELVESLIKSLAHGCYGTRPISQGQQADLLAEEIGSITKSKWYIDRKKLFEDTRTHSFSNFMALNVLPEAPFIPPTSRVYTPLNTETQKCLISLYHMYQTEVSYQEELQLQLARYIMIGEATKTSQPTIWKTNLSSVKWCLNYEKSQMSTFFMALLKKPEAELFEKMEPSEQSVHSTPYAPPSREVYTPLMPNLVKVCSATTKDPTLTKRVEESLALNPLLPWLNNPTYRYHPTSQNRSAPRTIPLRYCPQHLFFQTIRHQERTLFTCFLKNCRPELNLVFKPCNKGDTTAINYAIKSVGREKFSRVQQLLEVGTSPGIVQEKITTPNMGVPEEINPLLTAISSNQAIHRKPFIELLVAYGADVNEGRQGCSALLSAFDMLNVKKDDFTSEIAIIETLIKSGANIQDTRQYDASTPLHRALKNGLLSIAKLLIMRAKELSYLNTTDILNAKDRRSKTPLHFAVQLKEKPSGDVERPPSKKRKTKKHKTKKEQPPSREEILALLLKEGADPNLSSLEKPVLNSVIDYGESWAVPLLLNEGADPNHTDNQDLTPAHWASIMGETDILKVLLEHAERLGTEDLEKMLKAKDNKGNTPLHVAVDRNRTRLSPLRDHSPAIRLLLEKGANPNTPNEDGMTPFFFMIENRHQYPPSQRSEILSLCLDATTTIRPCKKGDHDGWGPLHFMARKYEHNDNLLFNKLLEKIDKRTVCHDNETPLHIAVRDNNITFTKLLLNAFGEEAILNKKNRHGNTALHEACTVLFNSELPILLICNGADINMVNGKGMTPLHLATQAHNVEVLVTLIAFEAPLNAPDPHGATPLHVATREVHHESCQILLEAGAHIDAQTNEKETPLHIAISMLKNKDIDIKSVIKLGEDLLAFNPDLRIKDAHSKTALDILENIRECAVDRIGFIPEVSLFAKDLRERERTITKFLVEKVHTLTDHTLMRFLTTHLSLMLDITSNTNPLHIAADIGDESYVQQFLRNGAEADGRDNDNQTPLHWAAGNGHVNIARELLNAGADVHATDLSDLTPLHFAAEKGSTAMANYLLSKEANPQAIDHEERTPLHIAAEEGHVAMANVLLDTKKVNIRAIDKKKRTPLHRAAGGGHAAMTFALLHHDTMGQQPLVNIMDQNKRTALHDATSDGHEVTIKILLFHGANPDIADDQNYTPVHIAAEEGNSKILKELLETRPNLNARTADGDTPLHLATKGNHTDAMTLLLSAGASVHALSNNDRTSLHIAAEYGHNLAIKILLAQKARVTDTDNKKLTPMHLAAWHGDNETITTLRHAQAPITAKNSIGQNPLHVAASRGHTDIVQLLSGIDFNERKQLLNDTDDEGETPLAKALKKGHTTLALTLLTLGSDVDHKDKNGKTLICVMASRGNLEIVQLLLQENASVNVGDKEGGTPLHWAAHFGHLNVVQALLKDHRINTIPQFTCGEYEKQTPLHRAIKERQIDVAIALIKASMDINLLDSNGNTPLHLAVQENLPQITAELLVYKANPNITGNTTEQSESYIHPNGNTPLHDAVENGYNKVTDILLYHNAHTHALNLFGHTPLHIAVAKGNCVITRSLLISGADINAPITESINEGATPLHIAAQEGHLQILSLLLTGLSNFGDMGANPNSRDARERTPLHIAAEKGFEQTCRLLLNSGADIHAKDSQGKTALSLTKNEQYFIRMQGTISLLTSELHKRKDSPNNSAPNHSSDKKPRTSLTPCPGE